MPARNLHDTRLLTNLIKTEKDAQSSFKAWTKDAASASAALAAWSVADSGDTQDLMDVSVRISQLLSACAESQRAYIHTLSAYRTSLKDILDRENSLRTVVRDREILVGRLIKLGNKKPSDSALESHQQKVDEAHRELAACETYLQDEEILLSEAKRKSFRDALAMRMHSMGELGRVMEESAHEAVDILSQLGEGEFHPEDFHHDHDDAHSDGGDSMTPSQSASQAMSRASSSESLQDRLSATAGQPTAAAIGTRSPRALSPSRAERSVSPARATSGLTNGAPPGRVVVAPYTAPPAPRGPSVRAALGPVPTAPRPISSYTLGNAADTLAPSAIGGGIPGFEIPKAPVNVASRRPDEDSSDEEDDRQFRAHSNGIPAGSRNSHYPYDAPASPPAASRGGGARLRRTHSDDSSVRGAGGRKRRGSFFGGLASLFRRKEKSSNGFEDRDSDVGRGSPLKQTSKWETRTDRNVFAAQRAGGGLGAGSGPSASVVGGGSGRFRRNRGEESSDEEDMPKNVVRVVNDPSLRMKAMSDIGRATSPAPSKPASLAVKKKKSRRAASDIGVSTGHGSMSHLPPPVPITPNVVAPKPSLTRNSSHASNATGMSKIRKEPRKPKQPVVPEESAEDAAEIVDDTPSIKKKKKKVKAEEPRTLVLSAESLGIPTSGGTGSGSATPSKTAGLAAPAAQPRSSGLSRSNTVTSTATATTTGTVKKKKKKAVAEAPFVPLPTAADLASSLPSATSTYNPITAPLPLPSTVGDTDHSTPAGTASATTAGAAGKVPKSLAASEKRSKRDSALYGPNDWVQHAPGTTTPVTHKATTKSHVKRDVAEGEDSLMTMVDRAGGGEDRTPSRKYGATPRAGKTSSGENNNGLAVPSLSKRKSVRLADGPDSTSDTLQPHHSPPSSIRSNGLAGADRMTSSPSRGILTNASPPSATASLWDTRANRRAASGAGDIDSSDEDEDGAYKKARKQFAKQTKGMQEVMTGQFTAAEKGKGKAE